MPNGLRDILIFVLVVKGD